jgi:hypothetical protein
MTTIDIKTCSVKRFFDLATALLTYQPLCILLFITLFLSYMIFSARNLDLSMVYHLYHGDQETGSDMVLIYYLLRCVIRRTSCPSIAFI